MMAAATGEERKRQARTVVIANLAIIAIVALSWATLKYKYRSIDPEIKYIYHDDGSLDCSLMMFSKGIPGISFDIFYVVDDRGVVLGTMKQSISRKKFIDINRKYDEVLQTEIRVYNLKNNVASDGDDYIFKSSDKSVSGYYVQDVENNHFKIKFYYDLGVRDLVARVPLVHSLNKKLVLELVDCLTRGMADE